MKKKRKKKWRRRREAVIVQPNRLYIAHYILFVLHSYYLCCLSQKKKKNIYIYIYIYYLNCTSICSTLTLPQHCVSQMLTLPIHVSHGTKSKPGNNNS